MSKRMLSVVALFAILLVPTALSAQKGDMEKMHKGMGCMEMCCKHGEKGLDLNQEQRIAIEKLELKLELANIDIKAGQMELKAKVKEELLKEEPSRKTIDKYTREIAANREKMHMNRIDHMFEIKKILTPEQWKVFVARHWDGMGRGHDCMDRGARGRGHDCGQRPIRMGKRDGCGMRLHREGKGTGEECPMEKEKAE
jgi:Spy/CpxP family protein refolding chaperone